jgi:hypothetical protein
MNDEDLSALFAHMIKMPPDGPINIGSFRCSAAELLVVMAQAVAFRSAATRPVPPQPMLFAELTDPDYGFGSLAPPDNNPTHHRG